jgi:transposase InsO family protein
MKYVLVLKDDLSSFVRLFPTSTADAKTTSDALISWFSDFGVVKSWVCDRGSHFKNEVVRSLREKTRGQHHFTLAYCPWSNGAVERVCRELLRATRALLSEFKLPP